MAVDKSRFISKKIVDNYITVSGTTNTDGVLVPSTDIPISAQINSCYAEPISGESLIIIPYCNGSGVKWLFKVFSAVSMTIKTNTNVTVKYKTL